LPIRF